MPINIVWEENHTLYVKYSGTINGSEARQSQETFGSDERFDGLKAILLDGSEIVENLYTEKDVEIISAIAIAQAKSNPAIKNAVVVDATDNGVALSAFYKFLADETAWDIELFSNEEEARQWLSKH
ncbi:hypothetical protein [Oceanicoccus sagamiensis]|uniref:STAS/SEC14 domain-containing protein n=1 Tax=Oceanicoccus sagamiensis TaxID=716816 RepID=A0A1X9NAD6_9GAMM|nr:hypothetical protein [Oceanicoccus sagamiensis]ARN74024.1 hypothetical protein BST96_07770 [Oceanicoccus sagamiensis]